MKRQDPFLLAIWSYNIGFPNPHQAQNCYLLNIPIVKKKKKKMQNIFNINTYKFRICNLNLITKNVCKKLIQYISNEVQKLFYVSKTIRLVKILNTGFKY